MGRLQKSKAGDSGRKLGSREDREQSWAEEGEKKSQEMEQAKHNTVRERTIKRMLTFQS